MIRSSGPLIYSDRSSGSDTDPFEPNDSSSENDKEYLRSVRVQNIGNIRLMLSKKVDPNHADKVGSNAFHYITRSIHPASIEILTFLKDLQVDSARKDFNDRTPFLRIIDNDNKEVQKTFFRLFTTLNLKVDTPDEHKRTILYHVYKKYFQDLSYVRELLEEFNWTFPPESRTPLTRLVKGLSRTTDQNQLLEHLEICLQRGANPKTSSWFVSPLYYACKIRHTEAVRLLIQHGAEPPLDRLHRPHPELIADIEFCIQNGYNPNQLDSQGFGGLHYAALAANKVAVSMLVRNGAINIADNHGVTPLQYAARSRCTETFNLIPMNFDPIPPPEHSFWGDCIKSGQPAIIERIKWNLSCEFLDSRMGSNFPLLLQSDVDETFLTYRIFSPFLQNQIDLEREKLLHNLNIAFFYCQLSRLEKIFEIGVKLAPHLQEPLNQVWKGYYSWGLFLTRYANDAAYHSMRQQYMPTGCDFYLTQKAFGAYARKSVKVALDMDFHSLKQLVEFFGFKRMEWQRDRGLPNPEDFKYIRTGGCFTSMGFSNQQNRYSRYAALVSEIFQTYTDDCYFERLGDEQVKDFGYRLKYEGISLTRCLFANAETESPLTVCADIRTEKMKAGRWGWRWEHSTKDNFEVFDALLEDLFLKIMSKEVEDLNLAINTIHYLMCHRTYTKRGGAFIARAIEIYLRVKCALPVSPTALIGQIDALYLSMPYPLAMQKANSFYEPFPL